MTSNSSPALSRRQAISSAIAGGLALGAASCAKSSPQTTLKSPLITAPPFIDTLLVNRERASNIMREAGVDAIICSRPDNIYYLTNYYPQLGKMGMEKIVYAILPLDINRAPILVVGQYEYFIVGGQGATVSDVDVRVFTTPSDIQAFENELSFAQQVDAPATASMLPELHNFYPQSPSQSFKRAETTRLAQEASATCETAFLKAFKDLPRNFKQCAIDDPALSNIILRAEIDTSFTNGEQMLRNIRLQKSDAEITLMKYAAKENAEAGRAAAKIARDGANFQDIRREYHRQCADRFLTPSFMVIDGVIPESAPGEISEGRAFLIDCVSHGQHYHGDYGRTVCVGEPTGEMLKATKAIAQVWDDLLPQLKVGMRYSEINSLAGDIFKKTNSSASLICNPHSVGLHHTDEPSVEGASFYTKDDLELLEGMIISVDLPVLDVGLGGSAHLEDIVLIGKDGATLLNDGGDRVITV